MSQYLLFSKQIASSVNYSTYPNQPGSPFNKLIFKIFMFNYFLKLLFFSIKRVNIQSIFHLSWKNSMVSFIIRKNKS